VNRIEKLARLALRFWEPFGFRSPLRVVARFAEFFGDARAYRRIAGAEPVRAADFYPCLWDVVGHTPVDPTYFYQDTWAARKIFEAHPAFHVDIGSTALLVGVLAQFTAVCSLDIRPLSVKLAGLSPCRGNGLSLPLASASVKSLSSLCVLEHIGLGRYGDSLDPTGSERAARELQRVLAPGGDLYVSVPIEDRDRTYFNAHRAFSVSSFLGKFPELTLEDSAFVQNHRVCAAGTRLDYGRRMVVGLFHLRRPGAGERG
jgi:SAM-dependent methyltransferase